ncbi:hypothetical protein SAICODRAFT_30403 [Saitoella complicata NRRL Y-17804]|uniref:uncharacterized protein n=1 Tax=Saitoella complicata (strain BCRC 22490 / CBS 7301 / JCM 7358 / NBRC 10748 / NRRL Y-17804) TaxID=698492 RepID=UPI000867163E|nr:uncharacterized protein SAICODRAFT_30403 [Saitoella complicata NRRL Y-17804]ODQ52994.1 hypothetical protein SAICODRAFT_30403 [Saitoella complicata NRRL Y-17804]
MNPLRLNGNLPPFALATLAACGVTLSPNLTVVEKNEPVAKPDTALRRLICRNDCIVGYLCM